MSIAMPKKSVLLLLLCPVFCAVVRKGVPCNCSMLHSSSLVPPHPWATGNLKAEGRRESKEWAGEKIIKVGSSAPHLLANCVWPFHALGLTPLVSFSVVLRVSISNYLFFFSISGDKEPNKGRGRAKQSGLRFYVAGTSTVPTVMRTGEDKWQAEKKKRALLSSPRLLLPSVLFPLVCFLCFSYQKLVARREHITCILMRNRRREEAMESHPLLVCALCITASLSFRCFTPQGSQG